jgi:hypothetical protein
MDQLREVERVTQTTAATPSRASRSPDPCLRSLIAGEYVGWWHDSLPFARWLEPPPPCLTLMISIGKPLRVCRRMREDPQRWAEIAYDCGSYDQPHMNRDFRELAGITPTDFLARQLPQQGTIGDGVTFVQDRTPTPGVP